MAKLLEIKKEYLGRNITAQVIKLDDGILVTLFGGERSHVGASAYADGDENLSFSPKGHKELAIAERWAKVLNERFLCPVTVNSGIHYDNLKKEQINDIVNITEEMLKEIK